MVALKRWLKTNRIPLALAGLHFALAVIYGTIIPIFEAPDENNHFFFIRQLALTGRIPDLRFESGPWGQQATQGPLFYIVAALPVALIDTREAETLIARTNPLLNLGEDLRPGNKNAWIHDPKSEAWPWRGAVLAVHAARWVSAFFGALTVWFTYHMAQTFNPRAGPAAGLMVAFLPQFVWGSGSITNDTAIAATAAFALWVLATSPPEPPRRHLLLLGIALGLAALAKTPGLVLAVYVTSAMAIQASRTNWRKALARAGFLILVVTLVAGPWLWMNWARYGDPTGLSAHLVATGNAGDSIMDVDRLLNVFQPESVLAIPDYVRAKFVSLWGVFGLHNISAPAELYSAFNWLTLAGFVGFGLSFFWPTAGERVASQRWKAWLSGWFVLHLIALVYWASRSGGTTAGRLLFPALPVIAFVCAAGWLRLADWVRWRPVRYALRASFPALLGIFALAAPQWLILPTYAPPPFLAALPPSTRLLNIHYGDLELIGVEAQPRLRPGDLLEITFYWRLTKPTRQEYILSPRLLDRPLTPVAGTNSYPGWGNWPVWLWEPGRIYADRYRLPVAEDAERPGMGRIILAVEADQMSQPPVSADGLLLDSLYPLAWVALPPPAIDVERSAPLAVFGNSTALLSVSFPGTAHPGDSIEVQLVWQALGSVSADWHRFIHVTDYNRTQPRIFTQRDETPAGGYGRPWWEVGEAIPDNITLDLPADLPAGEYALWGGFAEPSGERVPISGGDNVDGRLYLGKIIIN